MLEKAQITADTEPFDVEAIKAAAKEFNDSSLGDLLDNFPITELSPHGIEYAVLKELGSSEDDALLLVAPFSNYVDGNMYLRAEFFRRTLKYAGLSDEKGRSLPVFLAAAPSSHSTIRLRPAELYKTVSGEFDPVTEKYLHIIQHKNYGRVALTGFSFGADALAAGNGAAISQGMDSLGSVLNDPVRTHQRALFYSRNGGLLDPETTLAGAFGAEFEHLPANIIDSRLEPVIELTGVLSEPEQHRHDNAIKDIFHRDRIRHPNPFIAFGLKRGTFGRDVKISLSRSRASMAVTYAEEGLITGTELLKATMRALELEFPDHDMQLIEVQNATHAWGDNLPLHALALIKGFRLI